MGQSGSIEEHLNGVTWLLLSIGLNSKSDMLFGASVSEPLPSDVNVDFVRLSVCLSWTGVRRTYGTATVHASHLCTWQCMLLWLLSFVRA